MQGSCQAEWGGCCHLSVCGATDEAQSSTSPTYRTHLQLQHRAQAAMSLLLLGWQRQKVTSAGTHKTPCMPKHMHIHLIALPRSQPSYLPQECLFPGWFSLLLAADILHWHIPQALHTHGLPWMTGWIHACLMTRCLLLIGKPSLKFARKWDTHTHYGEDTGTLSIQAVMCGHAPATGAEPLTHLTHTSPSQQIFWTLFPPQQLAANTSNHSRSWHWDLPTTSSTSGYPHSQMQSWYQIQSQRTLSSCHFISTTHAHGIVRLGSVRQVYLLPFLTWLVHLIPHSLSSPLFLQMPFLCTFLY